MRQRDILVFWLPLFASWLLMTAEGPTISAAINRLPNEVVMLAAMGIVTSLSVTIESPIINMLATSTALVRDYDSYLLVRRFTIHWCIALTIVAILVAFTPLFDIIVRGWLDLPEAVAQWVQPGMKIMVFWSAAIGWRRFLQGILIRFHHTGSIAWGTAVRLLASAGTVIILALWGEWQGVIIGSLALMAGVIAEAIFATIVARPVIRDELRPAPALPADKKLTYRQLFWFHLPLAATSLLILLMQPLVTSSLARMEDPVRNLAAWPVLFQILLIFRAAALAFPEVVIALYQDGRNFVSLRRFGYWLTVAVTLSFAVFTFTPLEELYVYWIQDMAPEVGALVLESVPLFLLFPALAVITSWLRGLLIENRATRHVNIGMAINLTVTAVVLAAAVMQQWAGLPSAALALNLASLAEVVYLTWSAQHHLTLPLGLFSRPRVEAIAP
jgi:hypothetical protein